MTDILYMIGVIIIAIIIFLLYIFIIVKTVNLLGFYEDNVLDMSYILRKVYRFFFPFAIFMYLYPKYLYRDLKYRDDMTLIFLVVLIFSVIYNNAITWIIKGSQIGLKPRTHHNYPFAYDRGVIWMLVLSSIIVIAGIYIIYYFFYNYFSYILYLL